MLLIGITVYFPYGYTDFIFELDADQIKILLYILYKLGDFQIMRFDY